MKPTKKTSMMWNYIDYIDHHIAHYDNTDIWYLIWESANDNHLCRGQFVEVVKALVLLTTGDGWVCKLRLSSSFWAGCAILVQNCPLPPLSWQHLFNAAFLSHTSYPLYLVSWFCSLPFMRKYRSKTVSS